MSDADLPAPSPAPRGLTGDQDGRLRTLAALGEHGELAPDLQALHRAYRERDQRAQVRPPSPVTWPVLEERAGQVQPLLEEDGGQAEPLLEERDGQA